MIPKYLKELYYLYFNANNNVNITPKLANKLNLSIYRWIYPNQVDIYLMFNSYNIEKDITMIDVLIGSQYDT